MHDRGFGGVAGFVPTQPPNVKKGPPPESNRNLLFTGQELYR